MAAHQFQQLLTQLNTTLQAGMQSGNGRIMTNMHTINLSGKTTEDGDRFIEQVTTMANLNNWNEQAARAHMSVRLQDTAYNWFRSAVEDKPVPPTRAEWTTAFRAKFGRNNEGRRTEAQLALQRLRQGAATVDEF